MEVTISKKLNDNTYATNDGQEVISTLDLEIGSSVPVGYIKDKLYTFFPEETEEAEAVEKINPLIYKTQNAGKYIEVTALVDLRPPSQSFFQQQVKFSGQFVFIPTKLGNEFGYCGMNLEDYEKLRNNGKVLFLSNLGATKTKIMEAFKVGKSQKYQPFHKPYLVMWYRNNNDTIIDEKTLIDIPDEILSFNRYKVSSNLFKFLNGYEEEYREHLTALIKLNTFANKDYLDMEFAEEKHLTLVKILEILNVNDLDEFSCDEQIIEPLTVFVGEVKDIHYVHLKIVLELLERYLF